MLVVSSAKTAGLSLEVKGLSGDLEANVEALLSTIPEEEISDNPRFTRQVEETIRKGLRAKGYYDPEIKFDVIPSGLALKPTLTATVTPGEPVLIEQTNINITGQAKSDEFYIDLLKKDVPAKGTILDHGTYDGFKDSLSGLAIRRGFFDASIERSQLGVAAELHQAFWDIDFNSGDRYRFGKVTFIGSQIRDDYLQNLIPFKEGEYYTSAQLSELNRRLSSTNWFNSVVVSPNFDGIYGDKLLPLEGVLSPRTQNIIELGGGYSTDIGPRVKANWKKPWINDRGHSLDTGISLSAPEQVLDFSYKIPLQKSPLEQYYLLQSGYKHEDQNDTKSSSGMFNVARYWDSTDGWQRSVNLRWSLDNFTQGSVTNTTMLLYPGVSLNRTRQRGGLMPMWGDSQRYSLDVSETIWGSDVDFAVVQAQNVWIRSLWDKHRFIARGNLGWIETGDFSKVPPSLRFFAGGDRSIRGYKYKSLSPKDDDGKLTGASKLATGSLEYQYNVSGNWWAAAFADGGDAVNKLDDYTFKKGAGVGVRWASPIGPIKLDVATPIGDSDKHGMQIYIGLGPEL
ncbi:autotransporter assembly complex protein TamA [Limnobaculum parvum]|uniref:Translocation and assembly module subunit TamA n=1 Tax=Limnobaculum parvum TaxID=2172103 RepID=A0A2Y9TZU3_9GAMM|nr:autotransporter assembly complex family protein [Limnobaculum parvum]AWH89215.1 outer membrane protein assembly factor [Limnobaculum parvum]